MSDLALYRKYRPQKFAEVIGQEPIVKVLEGAIKLGNVAHAYLFAGSRGTGKTSVARILARELDCAPEDLYEIDAASNRGIDEIRALREGVDTRPFNSPVKVYLIDEVHMLTKEAFNALLKTLEEPPSHVVFILATTEIGRLPETIVSRCQTFTFQKPSHEELRKLILTIAKKEGLTIEASAADLLALAGDGSFRDAVGLLQKAVSASNDKKISSKEVEQVTGAPSPALAVDLLEAILNSQLPEALGLVRKVTEKNQDFKLFIKLILERLRAVLLLRLMPGSTQDFLASFSGDEGKRLLALKDHASATRLPSILRELLTAHEEVSKSYLPQLPLELALIKLLTPTGVV